MLEPDKRRSERPAGRSGPRERAPPRTAAEGSRPALPGSPSPVTMMRGQAIPNLQREGQFCRHCRWLSSASPRPARKPVALAALLAGASTRSPTAAGALTSRCHAAGRHLPSTLGGGGNSQVQRRWGTAASLPAGQVRRPRQPSPLGARRRPPARRAPGTPGPQSAPLRHRRALVLVRGGL